MKEQILELREKGYTYNQIVEELGCAKSTVAFHCGEGQKAKSRKRQAARRADNSLIKKTESFRLNKKGLNNKFTHFKGRANITYDYTYQDVIKHVGENPVCYITGRTIDLSDPSSYHFDHIIPIALGGDNSLENLGIACKEANMAKSGLSIESFISLCYEIIENYEQSPF